MGNRLARTGTLGSLGGQTFNFDKSDRLDNDSDPATASGLFDANGNTTSYGGTYQYDVENRLLNANSGAVVIVYDGDGNRIKKTAGGVTTWYLVATINPSGHAQVVEEKTGTTPSTLSRVYTYGLDLVSQREAGGTTYYFGYDGHGSTRFLMNGSTVANVFAYDSYGTLIASNTTAQTAYLYAGEQWDADLGMYYNRARYLNPAIGRFHTMDSYEGNNEDPLSLHKHLYANADPVMGLDPSGHNTAPEQGVVASGSSIVAGQTTAAISRAYAHLVINTLPRVIYGVEQTFFWLNVGTAGLIIADGALQATISVCEGVNKYFANNTAPISSGWSTRGGQTESLFGQGVKSRGGIYLGGTVAGIDAMIEAEGGNILLQHKSHDLYLEGLKTRLAAEAEALSKLDVKSISGKTGPGSNWPQPIFQYNVNQPVAGRMLVASVPATQARQIISPEFIQFLRSVSARTGVPVVVGAVNRWTGKAK